MNKDRLCCTCLWGVPHDTIRPPARILVLTGGALLKGWGFHRRKEVHSHELLAFLRVRGLQARLYEEGRVAYSVIQVALGDLTPIPGPSLQSRWASRGYAMNCQVETATGNPQSSLHMSKCGD